MKIMALINLINQRTIYNSIFFVLVIMLVIVWKPSIMFDENQNIKQFGVGDGKTIFSLGCLVAIVAFVSFYIFTVIDIIFAKKMVPPV